MNNAPEASSRDERLEAVLVAYLEAYEAGKSPDREQWLLWHPEFADDLREFFEAQDHVQRLAGPLREEIGPESAALRARRAALSGTDSTQSASVSGGLRPSDSGFSVRGEPSSLGVVRYFGDYELLEEVARGGMGVIYRARQSGLNRIVALKMILTGRLAAAEDVKRFRAEAEAAARLDHPHIVPVFEVGEHEGQHYFSMGFVDGESLADRLRDGPLPPRVAAHLARQVADAIAYAHGKGVIHRDLKPANVLLARKSDAPPATDHAQTSAVDDALNDRAFPWSAKITDFGLAKRLGADRGLTTTGQILGTPSYMPPEQATGRADRVKETADVYSLGAILYAMLTGRPPFQADNPLDTLVQVMETEPVAPRQLNPRIPADLETICLKCLEKEPMRRYSSAAELRDDLARFLRDEPIRARPLSTPEKAWRWLRKQGRSVALAAATIAATVVVGLFGLAIWYSYSQWRLGYLSLATDRPPLVVEILNEQGIRVAPTRTLPTSEPISLPAGEYRMQVTGEARFSQNYQLGLSRAQEARLDLNLEDQTLFPTFEMERSYDLAPLDGQERLVLFNDQGISCRDAVTLKELWSTPIKPSGNSGGSSNPLAKSWPEHVRWPWIPLNTSTHQYSGYDKFDRRPQLVGSRRDSLPAMWQAERLPPLSLDLNGDGADDFVLVARHQAWLAALDGKTGALLWFAGRGSDVLGQGDPQFSGLVDAVQSAVIGLPEAAGDLNDDGVVDLIATFVDRKSSDRYISSAEVNASRWVEAVSGKDGQPLWRYELPEEGFRVDSGGEPFYPYRLFTWATGWSSSGSGGYVTGREAIRSLNNRGEFTRNGEFIYAPDAARLVRRASTSDNSADAQNVRTLSQVVVLAGKYLVVLDTETGQPLASPLDTGRHPLRSLVLADVTGDGAMEAIVLGQRLPKQFNGPDEEPPLLAAYSLDPLKPIWERPQTAVYWESPRPQISRPNWPIAADLDGDGADELLTPCDTQRSTIGPYREESASGSLEVVGGRTGQRRWVKRLRSLDEQLDYFAIGPDVNQDGHREVFVATLLYGQTELFVDCLSGADGDTLWWTSQRLEKKDKNALEHWLCGITWWETGGDGWPQLLIALQAAQNADVVNPAVYLFSAGAGRMTAFAREAAELHLADADGDGRDELFFYRPWIGRDGGGRLDAHRNSPELWRRLGGNDWRAAGDLDNDGQGDLFYKENGRSIVAVSGADGRVLWRQTPPVISGDILAVPLGWDGDINGDGASEVLAAPNVNAGFADAWKPFHLLSGRDGKNLWSSEIEVRSLKGAPVLIEARDLDGDGLGEIILIAEMAWGWDLPVGSFGNMGNLWLAVLSGRTGAVQWKQPLTGANKDGSLTMSPSSYSRHLQVGEVRVAYGDLNGDRVLDLLLPAEIPGRENQFEIRAVSGKNGAVLWSRPLPPLGRDALELVFTAPMIGDVDGDGRNEAVAVTLSNPSQGQSVYGDCQAALVAWDGDRGQERWRWEGTRVCNLRRYSEALPLLRRPAPHLLRVAGQKQSLICVNFWSHGSSEPLAAEGSLDESTKNSSLIAVFDHQGKPLSRVPVRGTQEFAIWPLDADGDGGDELAVMSLSAEQGLRMIRPGAKNQVLWSRNVHYTIEDEVAGVVPAPARGAPALLVREGGGMYALDAASGEVLWKSLAPQARLGRSSQPVRSVPLLTHVASHPGESLLALREGNDASDSNRALSPAVAYQYGNVALVKRVDASATALEPRNPSLVVHAADDPRQRRLLPWMQNSGLGDAGQLLSTAQWLVASAFFTIILLVVPGAYLGRLVRQRVWNLRTFLLAPALVGLALVVLSMPLPDEFGRRVSWLERFSMAATMLPAVALVYGMLQAIRNRQWSKLLSWSLTTVFLAAALMAVILGIDRYRRPDAMPYSWEGWYWLWLIGIYYTGCFFILTSFVKWVVQAIRHWQHGGSAPR